MDGVDGESCEEQGGRWGGLHLAREAVVESAVTAMVLTMVLMMVLTMFGKKISSY
jgi:hypothetical protein